jgi:acetyl-CoA C-acetyltransferase
MTHALAAMVETLRADPGSYGVTSGVGMHMQKHAYGVWSTDPGSGPLPDLAPAAPATAPLAIVEAPEGKATVATYTVLHGRDGGPERAVLVCDVPGGGRCYALLGGGVPALAGSEADELIGRTVTLTPADGVNHASLG